MGRWPGVWEKKTKITHVKEKNDRLTGSSPDEVDVNFKPCQGTLEWPQEQRGLRACQVTLDEALTSRSYVLYYAGQVWNIKDTYFPLASL